MDAEHDLMFSECLVRSKWTSYLVWRWHMIPCRSTVPPEAVASAGAHLLRWLSQSKLNTWVYRTDTQNWRSLLDERWNIFKQDQKSSCFLTKHSEIKMTWMTENIHGHGLMCFCSDIYVKEHKQTEWTLPEELWLGRVQTGAEWPLHPDLPAAH